VVANAAVAARVAVAYGALRADEQPCTS